MSAHPAAQSWRRIFALMLRHFYLMRGSWPRVLDLIYWPTMQMVLWGFITLFLITNSTWVAQAAGVLLSAVLLWDILFRGNISLFLSFEEEVWSRNLGHLMVSPLRPGEFVAALIATSLVRTVIGVGGAAALAAVMFDYSILDLGLPLAAFFVNLIVLGWALGLLVSGMVLRFGQGAESLAWAAVFLIQPVSGVYYPVAVLPDWLQPVARALPSAHVFEGMRALLVEHRLRLDLLAQASLLNLVYLGIGVAAFLGTMRMARVKGLLLQIGE
ncbi:MAG TPA: ABC transporter permease [Alphaproteobacteria bacterium]